MYQVQTYQNPSDVKASVATVSKTYDAKLDNLATTQQTSQDQQSTQNKVLLTQALLIQIVS